MAILLADGFDGFFQPIWYSTGSNGTGTSVQRFGTGAYALPLDMRANLPANAATIYGSIAVYRPDGSLGLTFGDGGTTAQCAIFWSTDTNVYFLRGTTAGTILGSATVGTQPVAQWHSYQFRVVIHNTAGSFELRKNGATSPIISLSGINTRGATNNYTNHIQLTRPNTNNVWCDDLLICDDTGTANNSWTGDIRIETMFADGVGASSDFTPTGAATGWQANTTNNGDTSYSAGTTAGQQDLYAITDMPTNPTSIKAVIPFIIARKTDAGARTLAVRVKSGSAEVNATTNPSVGQTYTASSVVMETDPDTSAAWTKSAVDALQVGPRIEA
jgi:hypothetical protein